MKVDMKNLAQRYLFEIQHPHPIDPFSEDRSAFDEVYDLTHEYPEKAWTLILELLRQSGDDKSLAVIASGPLEDLICNHPYIVIDRVLDLAKNNARFRKCLKGVWGKNSMPKHIRKCIDEAVAGVSDW